MSSRSPEEDYVGDGIHYTVWRRGKRQWTLRFKRRTFDGAKRAVAAELPLVPLNKILILDPNGQLYVGWRTDK